MLLSGFFLSSMSAKVIRFSLNLSYDDYAKVYQGIAKNVYAVTDDGRSVTFPTGNIQSFLTRDGIHGYFEMLLTAENKFVSIRQLK